MDNTVQSVKDKLLTPHEVAEILQISVGTIYNRSAPKSKNPFPIRPKRIARRLRFSERDVQEYIAAL